MSSKSHIILASGVNRAIEFAILYSLATAMPSSILLGCRETAKGEAAISDLRAQGIASTIIPIHLDVTSDDTVKAAIEAVVKKYGKLDVLIENAGSAVIPPGASDDPQGHRAAFQSVYDVKVTSVALCMALFLPLLRKSGDGRVINGSSGRASLQILTSGAMPPPVSIPYSISKVALNAADGGDEQV